MLAAIPAEGLAALADQLMAGGEWATARDLLEQAVALGRTYPDRRSLWVDTQNLAVAQLRTGEFAASRRTLERALELAKDLNDLDAVALSTFQLARVAQKERDFPRAREGFERAASLASQAGDGQLRGDSLAHAARVRYVAGDLEGALQTLAEAWADMPSNSPMAAKWRAWLNDEKAKLGAKAFAALLEKLEIAPGIFAKAPGGRRGEDRRH